MAKCDLTIELDEPNRVYRGGDIVSGTLHVRVDQNVKCNGLSIRTIWETHGKGNVARGVTDEQVVYQGNWLAGTKEQYRFELECANWPPTYHGFHLNIDHYIEAQVDIPWAIDPKSKTPFQLLPIPDGSRELVTKNPTHGVAGKIVGGILIAVFGIAGILFLVHPCMWVLAIGAAGWWFWAKYLPKKKLGDVQFRVLTPQVPAGNSFQAEIVMAPSSQVSINRIKWKVLGEEVVVRGHGTDSKTYRHTVVEHQETVAEDVALVPQQENRFVLEFPLPADAPASIDLDYNDVRWTVEGYIDIPRWPDWKKTETFQVIPTGASPTQIGVTETKPTANVPTERIASVSFQATVDLLAKIRTNATQRDRVLESVRGKDMEVNLRIARPISVGRIDASVGYPDGRVFEGSTDDEQLSVLVYAPRHRQQELDSHTHQRWSGWGQITGYDENLGSLQVKIAEQV